MTRRFRVEGGFDNPFNIIPLDGHEEPEFHGAVVVLASDYDTAATALRDLYEAVRTQQLDDSLRTRIEAIIADQP